MPPGNEWGGQDSLDMTPLNSFTQFDTDDMRYAEITNNQIRGCVMVNRYDEQPETLVITCRGTDNNHRTSRAESGVMFYDISDDTNPRYLTHTRLTHSVEGQDTIGGTLIICSFDGKIYTFRDWVGQLNGGNMQLTAQLQTSSYSLLHLKAFTWQGENYVMAATGFSYTWPDKTCDVETDENFYNCGNPDERDRLRSRGQDVRRGDNHDAGFDGVVIIRVTDPANPQEIARVCLKVKCPEGTSIFFGSDGKPYGTVGGVNSEYMAVIDLSTPDNPTVVAETYADRINQLVPLYGIHEPLGPDGLYEAYASWGLPGGLSVWNLETPSSPKEVALVETVECANANRAIFWNERYILTPLQFPGFGGVCVFDVCEVNKPRLRSWMHFNYRGPQSASRMTYAMNAHGKTAYFAMYTRDLLQTYTINDDQFSSNTVVKLANGQVYYNEDESVFLNGMDADTCGGGAYSTSRALITTTSGPTEQIRYWAFDGCTRNNDNSWKDSQRPNYYDPDSNIARVVCCSHEGDRCDRDAQTPSGRIDCRGQTSWYQAKALCAEAGMRLCQTQEEINRCCGQGCDGDDYLSWSGIQENSLLDPMRDGTQRCEREEQCYEDNMFVEDALYCTAKKSCKRSNITVARGAFVYCYGEEACREASITCAGECLLSCDGDNSCRDMNAYCRAGNCFGEAKSGWQARGINLREGPWYTTDSLEMSNGTCGVGFKPVTTENECLLTIKNHEHPNGAKCYESEGEWLWYFPDTPRWEKQYACIADPCQCPDPENFGYSPFRGTCHEGDQTPCPYCPLLAVCSPCACPIGKGWDPRNERCTDDGETRNDCPQAFCPNVFPPGGFPPGGGVPPGGIPPGGGPYGPGAYPPGGGPVGPYPPGYPPMGPNGTFGNFSCPGFFNGTTELLDVVSDASNFMAALIGLVIIAIWLLHIYAWIYYDCFDRAESRTLSPSPVHLQFKFSWTAPGGGYQVRMDVPADNKSGNMVYILGYSGAGKTSLLETLAGIRTSGTLEGYIEINGEDYTHDTAGRGRMISLIRQFEPASAHWAEFTGWDIIHMRNLMTDPTFHVIRNVEESGFQDTFEFLGLTTEILGRKWKQLSGGQKIRVRLAGCLLVPRAIIIADELTSGLDAVTALDVLMLLKRLTIKFSLNVWCAVHQPSGEVLALADQITILEVENPKQGVLTSFSQTVDLFDRKDGKEDALTKELFNVGVTMFDMNQRMNTEIISFDEDKIEDTSNSWSAWTAIMYRTVKLMSTEGYSLGKSQLITGMAFVLVCIPLFWNIESPSLFHFFLFFVLFVPGSLSAQATIDAMMRDYHLFNFDVEKAILFPSHVIYWGTSVFSLFVFNRIWIGLAQMCVLWIFSQVGWSHFYILVVTLMLQTCMEISMFVGFVLMSNGTVLGREMGHRLLNLFITFSGMIFPWSTVTLEDVRKVKYFNPSYWVVVCLTNEAHRTKDDWDCRDEDSTVECLSYRSGDIIEAYGLDEGSCELSTWIIIFVSAALIVIGLNFYIFRSKLSTISVKYKEPEKPKKTRDSKKKRRKKQDKRLQDFLPALSWEKSANWNRKAMDRYQVVSRRVKSRREKVDYRDYETGNYNSQKVEMAERKRDKRRDKSPVRKKAKKQNKGSDRKAPPTPNDLRPQYKPSGDSLYGPGSHIVDRRDDQRIQAMDKYYSNQSDGGARMDALPSDSFMSPSVFTIEPGTLPQGLRTPDPYDPHHLENIEIKPEESHIIQDAFFTPSFLPIDKEEAERHKRKHKRSPQLSKLSSREANL